MRSRFHRIPLRSLAAAAITLAAVAFACGREESKPTAAPTPEPEAAQPAAPVPAPAAPTPAAEIPAPATPAPQGEAVATDGVIPEGYPSDIPVYPGAEPGPAMSTPGLGVFATFESDDTVEAILAHYRTELANSGWAVQDTPDGGGIDGTKQGRSVQVRARTAENGRSEIAVSAGES
jgi:hypothetical protein